MHTKRLRIRGGAFYINISLCAYPHLMEFPVGYRHASKSIDFYLRFFYTYANVVCDLCRQVNGKENEYGF